MLARQPIGSGDDGLASLAASELAAFFSKARDGGKVEVHYCRAGDVSKPRGFAPGKVMLKQWKSLRVYPKG